MYAEEIKKLAIKRARERQREKAKEWTLKYESLKDRKELRRGEKITEADEVLYRQIIKQYS